MKQSILSLPCVFILLLTAVVNVNGASDYATPYAFSTLAGTSAIGSADGTGAAARFFSPRDVTTDADGNIFIVDVGNHTIRKATPAGVVTTLAGSPGLVGSADGTGAAARFNSPQGIAADAAGNLYVADTDNHTIRKITPTGVVTTFAGLAGVTGNTDATGTAARFNRPRKLALDASGNLYVTETGNNDVRKITPAGIVTTFATNLKFPETADLNALTPIAYGAIAIDTAGNVYVAAQEFAETVSYLTDTGYWWYTRYIGYVHQLTPTGGDTRIHQTLLYRYYDGRIVNYAISALAFSSNGQLIAAVGYQVGRLTPGDSGFYELSTFAGDGTIGGSDGPADTAKFGFPLSLACDRNGVLYVADTGNNVLRKVSLTGTVTTIAGLALESAANPRDGTGATARFNSPAGTAVDANGNVFVADPGSHCIRKITPAGVVTTFAGSPGVAGSADGTGTAARFYRPFGLAVDAAGNVFVADDFNHTIRRISPGGETSTFAGTAGTGGWQDGTGTDAQFWYPLCVALDQTGNVYVTSSGTIRKITPAGVVTTLAGLDNESGYVDGAGSTARFSVPTGIAVDANGNVFVTEAPGSPTIARIRKITPAGVVSTIAGADHGYADGSGTSARFYVPAGLAIDPVGNLFVADAYNMTVRKVTPQGAVTTVAGLADAPGGADGTGREARFYFPQGIALDQSGKLYVSSGTTVRKGELASTALITSQPASLTVAAAASAQFSVTASGTPAPTYQWNFNGNPIGGATGSTFSLTNVRTSDAGDYTVVITNALGSVTSSKATLTVTVAPTPPTPPPPAPASSGGGGGGALEPWFLPAIAVLAVMRRWRGRRP